VSDFRVVSAHDLADEIVRRLACNELPAEIGGRIREYTKHGECWCQFMLPLQGMDCLVLHVRMKVDGAIVLGLDDYSNRPFWETTLRPAEVSDAA